MSKTAEYIANCIDNILAAECHPSQHRQRTLDLAEAVYQRARNGEDAAHRYLVDLANAAQAGKYKEAKR
jgi:hypothetical protein